MCNFARRTGARPAPHGPAAPVPQAGETLRRRSLPAPGAQGWGWGRVRPCKQRAMGTQSSDLTSQVLQTAPGGSPRHLLRPPPAVPWSPASGPRKTTRSLYPSRRPSPGDARRREERASGRGWDVKRLSQPSPLTTPTPTRQPSRGAWSGRWGEERRLFWVLGIASSSFILRRQLQRLRALPGSSSQRSGDPSARSPGSGDAGAAGGTCGSSRRRRSPRRQQSEPRQPQPLRPGQPPPRSQLLMRLLAPGPAAPGGCGSSASQQLFADCSCFKVRRRSGQLSGQARTPHPRAHHRSCAALGLPSGSLAAARVFRGARWEGLQIPRCRRGGSGGLVGLWLQMVGLRGRKKLG